MSIRSVAGVSQECTKPSVRSIMPLTFYSQCILCSNFHLNLYGPGKHISDYSVLPFDCTDNAHCDVQDFCQYLLTVVCSRSDIDGGFDDCCLCLLRLFLFRLGSSGGNHKHSATAESSLDGFEMTTTGRTWKKMRKVHIILISSFCF